MLDLKLLRILRHKEDFRRVVGRVPAGAFDAATHTIINDFGRYFEQFPDHTSVDISTFLPMFRAWHPTLGAEKLAAFDAVLNKVQEPVSPDERSVVMQAVLELRLATDLQKSIEQWNDGELQDIRQALKKHMESFKADAQISDIAWITDDIGELLQDDLNDAGLHWRLACLNNATRPLRPGDSLVIAGRPDKGKTTLVSSEITHWAQQLRPEQNILWLNNEGPGKRIKPRLYQSALGITRTELVKLWQRNQIEQEYERKVGRWDKIRIFDIHGKDVYSVEQIIEANNAGVVVFDMIDHIRGFEIDSSRPDIRFEEMYKWARQCAVEMEFVSVATSQISNEGDGMRFPTLGMLKDSKCFAAGTPVRMYDGTVKAIETITVGEQVMGIDGTPRNVVGTGSGEQPMYRVSWQGGSFECNESHNLTVLNNTSKRTAGLDKGEFRRMPLTEFLAHPSYQHRLGVLRCRIPYQHRDLPMDPYLFGLWLGDGAQREMRITSGDTEVQEYLRSLPQYKSEYKQSSNCVDFYLGPRSQLDALGVRNNKHIPQMYKTASLEQRMQLLAGLMDSDGTIDHGTSVIAMSDKRMRLLDDIQEVAQSLGYKTFRRTKESTASASVGFAAEDALPCLIGRKVHVCEYQTSRMTVEPIGHGTYYGITVDVDSRYCSGDYVSLENTGKQGACDLQLMIGAVNDPSFANQRFIGLPKNKIRRDGGPSDPQETVHYKPEIGRYEDLAEAPVLSDIPEE